MIEDTFTSTGKKFMRHAAVMYKLQMSKLGTPIQLHVAPTSRCNLKCGFCSVANRDRHEELDVASVKDFTRNLAALGLRSVEITGGGEPLLYKHIETLIHYFSKQLCLKVGLITNGTMLNLLDPSVLRSLTWIRVSMNAIDYVQQLDLPQIPNGTTLGFSYVVNADTTYNSFPKLELYVTQFRPSYVRVLNNCLVGAGELVAKNAELALKVERLGHPYFLQAKQKKAPVKCLLGYFKPFLYCDGYIYPCSSTVLNDDAERQFHHKYRLVKADELFELYKQPVRSLVDTNLCQGCVYTKQNELLSYIAAGHIEHEEFI